MIPEATLSLRNSGLNIIGDVRWGTHFCQFYKTKKDLVDILVPYFKSGLENNEFCMWVTSAPLDGKEAEKALRKAVPDLDRYKGSGQIEIIPYTEWYVKDGAFSSQRVLNGWVDKLNQALAKGYDGLRLTGNTFWLEEANWQDFTNYEAEVDSVIGNYHMIAMCTYSLEKCSATEVVDVVRNHEFALIKYEGRWEIIESSELKRAREALKQSQEALLEELSRTKLLQDVATATTTSPDLNRVADEILKALNEHMHLKSGIIYLLDKEKQALRSLSEFAFPKAATAQIKDISLTRKEFLVVQAVQRGKMLTHKEDIISPEREKLLKEAGAWDARYVAIPFEYRGKAVGTTSLTFEKRRDFTQEELKLFNSIGHIMGQAMENARLYEAQRNIADTLQEALLTMPEKIDRIEFGHLYRSATESTRVGGDFYDLFEMDHGKVGIILGDVSGKGLEAATMTSAVRNTIRAYALEGNRPAEVMAKTNNAVKAISSAASFITVFFAILDVNTGELLYCSAGHPPAIIKRKNQYVELLRERSLVIGAFANVKYEAAKAHLDRGDILILYTDGITEARNHGALYGEKRLVKLIDSLEPIPAQEVPQTILDDVTTYAGGKLVDDMALLAVSLKSD
ncbi:MAG TPA: MEDS domain-containing protein [Anaerolineae bacterium]|nr:MEDS domain-containing protein [Anaerolineae bacterium]